MLSCVTLLLVLALVQSASFAGEGSNKKSAAKSTGTASSKKELLKSLIQQLKEMEKDGSDDDDDDDEDDDEDESDRSDDDDEEESDDEEDKAVDKLLKEIRSATSTKDYTQASCTASWNEFLHSNKKRMAAVKDITKRQSDSSEVVDWTPADIGEYLGIYNELCDEMEKFVTTCGQFFPIPSNKLAHLSQLKAHNTGH